MTSPDHALKVLGEAAAEAEGRLEEINRRLEEIRARVASLNGEASNLVTESARRRGESEGLRRAIARLESDGYRLPNPRETYS